MSSPKESLQKRFGEHLRSVRASAGHTQDGLAALMVDRGFRWIQTTVTKTEAGTRPLLLEEFVALNEALDQDPAMVLLMLKTPMTEQEMFMASLRSEIRATERVAKAAESQLEYHQEQLRQLRTELERHEAEQ